MNKAGFSVATGFTDPPGHEMGLFAVQPSFHLSGNFVMQSRRQSRWNWQT
jgi:hypothetical protein